MKSIYYIALLISTSMLLSLTAQRVQAQDCDLDVPVFDVDLTSDPNAVWLSPFVIRNGNCCGTMNPDRCVAFIITLHPDAEGIIFDVCDGAVSPGAMFYQVDCGPQVQVGESLCLDGSGPHYLTFCKPGNNENVYCITSISEPDISPGQVVGDGCSANLSVWGFDPTTIAWNSISPGVTGQYNAYLNCTTCENVVASSQVNNPITVVYEVCGLPFGGCDINFTCVQVEVTFVPGLSLDIFPDNPIVCYGENFTEVEAVVLGGLAPLEILWSDGTSGTSANLPPGNAWLSVNDATNCPTVVFNFVVEQLTEQPTVSAGADMVICTGQNTVDLMGSYTNADGAVWTGGTGYFVNPTDQLNNAYVPTNDEIQNGFILTLTTTDLNNCPVYEDQVAIEMGMVGFEIVENIQPVLCYGNSDGAINLECDGLSGPFNYVWNNGAVQSEINNLGPGNYAVTITDVFGCDTTFNYVFEAPLLPSVIAGNDQVICSGINQVELQGNFTNADGAQWGGGSGYFLLPANQINNTYFPSPEEIQSGFNLTLSTIHNNNCPSYEDQISVALGMVDFEVNEELNPVFCYGISNGSISLECEGLSAPFSYLWNTGADQSEINNLAPGNYSVSITDIFGCDTTFNYFFVAPLEPSVYAGNDQVLCSGIDEVQLLGSFTNAEGAQWVGGNGNFLLPPNQIINTYFPSAEEIQNGFSLSLETINQNGCPVYSDQIDISLGFVDLEVTEVVSGISCFGYNNGAINLNCEGLSGPFTYLWNNNSQSAQIGNLSPGNYTVTITDNIGCDTTFTYVLLNPQPLEINVISIENISCYGFANGSVSIEAIGGTPPLNAFLYNTQLEYIGFNIDNISPGPYQLMVTDVNGCQVVEEIEFTEPTEIVANFSGAAVICPGENVSLDVEAFGGTGDLSYSWNFGLSNSSTHNVSPATTTTYAVTITDEAGCTVGPLSQSVEVMVLTMDGLLMSADQGVCPGEPAEIEAQFYGNYGPYTYQWNYGLGTQPGSFNVFPEYDSWYTFTVYDVCGNTLIDSVNVHIYEVPAIDLPGHILDACVPFEVDFTDFVENYEGATYNWNFGDGYFSFSSDPSHEYDSPGIYNASVLLTTPDGCVIESTSSGTIIGYENPEINIHTDYTTTTLENPEFLLTGSSDTDILEFRWFETDEEYSVGNTLELVYSDTGTYVITLIGVNEYGCADSETTTLQVIPIHNLIIPNIFTPNDDYAGDGSYNPNSLTNDIFYPFTEYVKEFELLIFNRWGELIFESTDPLIGWNGYYKGEICQQDVYVYKLKVEYTDGLMEARIGDLTLLR